MRALIAARQANRCDIMLLEWAFSAASNEIGILSELANPSIKE